MAKQPPPPAPFWFQALISIIFLGGLWWAWRSCTNAPPRDVCTDLVAAAVVSEAFVERNLSNPLSADFDGYSDRHMNRVGDTLQHISYVEAVNDFNVKKRLKFSTFLTCRNGRWTAHRVQFVEL